MGTACPGGASACSHGEQSEEAPPTTSKEMLAPDTGFYMNFKLLNIDIVFPKIMRAKLRAKGRNEYLVRAVGAGGQVIAAQPRFWSVFSNKIADTIALKLPAQMKEMGLTLALSKVHCGERGFIVFRGELLELDLMKMVEGAKGEEFAEKLRPFVGMARHLSDLDRRLVPVVQEKIKQKLEATIPAKLKEKAGFNLLLITKASSEQADFFFNALMPHSFETSIKLLNLAEVAPKVLQERAAGNFGNAPLLGQVAGAVAAKVASHVVTNTPSSRVGKRIARNQSRLLPEYAARLGVTLVVAESFVAEGVAAELLLHCEIHDVDIEQFHTACGVLPAGIAPDQQLLRLGHKGRQSIYMAARDQLKQGYPSFLLAERHGLKAEVDVREVQPDPPPEMIDLDGLSDDDDDAQTP